MSNTFIFVPSLAVASMKLRSHQGQAVTMASAPVDFASSIRSVAVQRENSGYASRRAAAGAAAPGGFLDALHLDQLHAGNRLQQFARRLVDAEGAVVARPRRVVADRLAEDLLLLAAPGHVRLALPAQMAGS